MQSKPKHDRCLYVLAYSQREISEQRKIEQNHRSLRFTALGVSGNLTSGVRCWLPTRTFGAVLLARQGQRHMSHVADSPCASQEGPWPAQSPGGTSIEAPACNAVELWLLTPQARLLQPGVFGILMPTPSCFRPRTRCCRTGTLSYQQGLSPGYHQGSFSTFRQGRC